MASQIQTNRAKWQAQVGATYSFPEVCQQLGINNAELGRWVGAGEVLMVFEPGGVAAFPAWQFGPEGVAYPDVVRAMNLRHCTAEQKLWWARWAITTKYAACNGQPPAVWLQAGGDPRPIVELVGVPWVF